MNELEAFQILSKHNLVVKKVNNHFKTNKTLTWEEFLSYYDEIRVDNND